MRSTRTTQRASHSALGAVLVVVLSACTGSSSTAPSVSPVTGATGSPSGHQSTPPVGSSEGPASSTGIAGGPGPSPQAHLHLVAIGDSLDQPSSCPGCVDYVDLYGRAVAAATGRPVDVDNRSAIELSALPAVQSSQLLDDLLTDQSLRAAVAAADVIVISVGFNDTPWGRIDNPCGASNLAATVVDWSLITPACIARVADEYAQTLNEIVTQIDELRGCFIPPGLPPTFCQQAGRRTTMIRLVTVYDDWIGEAGTPAAALGPTEAADRAFVAAQCWVVLEQGGQCADIYHALNGSAGTSDAAPFLVADHTHFNQAGHQRIADVLAKVGFDPLTSVALP